MAVEHNSFDAVDRFLLFAEQAASQKELLNNSQARNQLNSTCVALNKQIRAAIASGDIEGLIEIQRVGLRFTTDVYGRKSDQQSLMLLNKVEDQFRLVQDPDKYKKDIEYALGAKGAAALQKAPVDIVEQFTKRQRANMTKFSGFETPAEKQFMTLQKDMANTLLKLYRVQQDQALGFDTAKAQGRTKTGKGLER